jgi:release factor glutamine methyltransferase
VVALLAKQHLLPSSIFLLGKLADGGHFSRIGLITKSYSDIGNVAKLMPSSLEVHESVETYFNTAIDLPLVLLDEGGGLHDALPKRFSTHSAGAEQTTAGLRADWKYPVVLVCRSAAKLIFESQIIARGILRKLESLNILPRANVGVIGLGALGSEIARMLLAKGVPTVGSEAAYVPSDLKSIAVTLEELLRRSDIILGCTGIDVLQRTAIGAIGRRRVFASCSSNDIEFRSVLTHLPRYSRFGAAEGTIGATDCTVLNGGFPINFDRETEWEAFDEIVLTRQLCFEGIIQSKGLIGKPAGGMMLNPATQMRVVSDWLEHVPDRGTIHVPEPLSEAFFRNHSEGAYLMKNKPTYTLHSTTPGALAKMRAHKEPYDVLVMGLPIIVLPTVWSPAYDWSSLFYVENLPQVRDREFLEIGCGTGVISVFAARAGAARVVATDVNEEAVRNARLNFERFGVKNAEALISDGFVNVQDKFDLITWNAPYHGSKPADILERGCADEGYRDIRQFFRNVSNYLKPGGIVVFGFSESGDLPLIETLIQESGLRVRRKLSDWREDYNCMLFDLVWDKPASVNPSMDRSESKEIRNEPTMRTT